MDQSLMQPRRRGPPALPRPTVERCGPGLRRAKCRGSDDDEHRLDQPCSKPQFSVLQIQPIFFILVDKQKYPAHHLACCNSFGHTHPSQPCHPSHIHTLRPSSAATPLSPMPKQPVNPAQ